MYDVAVLGGGLMGSSAAWQLAKAGRKVLLLEQQRSEYTFGSSFGEARICRSLGPKHDIWSYLHRRAVEETKELIAYLNKVDTSHHNMEDIYTTSPVTYILHTTKAEVVKRMLDQQDDEYKCSTTPEEARALFGVSVQSDQIVIQEYKEHTGTINPKALISKLHAAIALKQSQVLYHQKIKRIQKNSKEGGFEIEVLNGSTGEVKSIKCKQVVSSLGPYTGEVLHSLNSITSKLITPQRVPLSFFKLKQKSFEKLSGDQRQRMLDFLPVIDLGPTHHFSMIEKLDQLGNPLLKTGGHFLRSGIESLDDVWKNGLTKEEVAWSKKNLLDYFEFLGISIDSSELVYDHGYSCVYSLTQSEIPIVDLLPDNQNYPDPNFALMGGMSGVGAKGAMTYGKIAANLLIGNNEPDLMYNKTLAKLSFETHELSRDA